MIFALLLMFMVAFALGSSSEQMTWAYIGLVAIDAFKQAWWFVAIFAAAVGIPLGLVVSQLIQRIRRST